MTSMTGFGYSERSDDAVSASVEVKSVNNRYLDVNVSLPNGMAVLEPRIRLAVGEVVHRGRVEVTVRVREFHETAVVHLDKSALAAYQSALTQLKDETGCEEPLRLSHYLRMEGILRMERERDAEGYWSVVEPLLANALEQFRNSRNEEGAALRGDIESQVARIAAGLYVIETHAPQIEQTVRTSLGQRFAEVVGDGVEESRMLAEVAVQLARFSINEEAVRLNAHLEAITEAIRGADAGSGVGKRLDFICQEINREINTIGSKSTVLTISEQVIEVKDALENIREQLRNVE